MGCCSRTVVVIKSCGENPPFYFAAGIQARPYLCSKSKVNEQITTKMKIKASRFFSSSENWKQKYFTPITEDCGERPVQKSSVNDCGDEHRNMGDVRATGPHQILEQFCLALSKLQFRRAAYNEKINVAYELTNKLQIYVTSMLLVDHLSYSLESDRNVVAKACTLLLVFLRKLASRLATRISRERSHCPVARVARARLVRYSPV